MPRAHVKFSYNELEASRRLFQRKLMLKEKLNNYAYNKEKFTYLIVINLILFIKFGR
jgi:hypothetical protein